MSLTYTAYVSRNIIKYGGASLVAFTVLWMITAGALKAYQAAHPPYIPPTVRYGKLPGIVFPEKQFDKSTFSLELPNDAKPKFSDQAKVYVVYRPNNSFLALEYDKKTAKDLGFSDEPTEIQQGVYEFKNNNLNKILTMNVLNGSFKISYPYLTDQLLLTPDHVPAKDEAIETASEFLKNANKFLPDLAEGEKKVSFWKIEFDGLKPVSSQAEAQVARVDFYRKNLEDLKIVTADLERAPVSILISGSLVENKKIIEVDYKYTTIDRESFSTYPIKTLDQALEELNNGNYWLASKTTPSNVVIRKIYLAYFEPVTLTNYMEPVFVFEGDGGFMGYVPAVANSYIQ